MANEQEMQVGKVVQVIGAVVDIAFDFRRVVVYCLSKDVENTSEAAVAYRCCNSTAGVDGFHASVPVDVICETMQHLGDGVVRDRKSVV